MTVENQGELFGGGNNIKKNKETDNNFDDEPNFVRNTKIYDTYSVSNLVTGLATEISSETNQMLLLPTDLPTVPK